jgi:hypothetical protein
MRKYLFLFSTLSLLILSCEEPVHEEYNLYGNPPEIDNPEDGENTEVYFPLNVGNKWVYETEQDGQTIQFESIITGTTEIEGETYYTFNPEVQNSTTLYNNIRKAEDDYVSTSQTYSAGLTSNYFSQIIMKDNVSVGDTWSSQYTIIYDINGTSLEYPYTVNYEVEAIHDTYEVNGVEYQQVAQVKSQNINASNEIVEFTVFYALNIGIIKRIISGTGSAQETILVSYELQ